MDCAHNSKKYMLKKWALPKCIGNETAELPQKTAQVKRPKTSYIFNYCA